MRRWVRGLLVASLVLLFASTASALSGSGLSPVSPVPNPALQVLAPIPVAFDPIPRRNIELADRFFDLNDDGAYDLQVDPFGVTGTNGTTVLLLNPPVLGLDDVQTVPAAGYKATQVTVMSRVFVAKLPDGGYARFIFVPGKNPTIEYSYGKVTPSQLRLDGTGGKAVLEWDALPDADLGYQIYRYEFVKEKDSHEFEALTDFPVLELSFTENTAKDQYYVYQVTALRADGTYGSRTTAAPVKVLAVHHTMRIPLSGTATLDGAEISMDAPAVIVNGRMMVPATVLANAGVKVSYEPSTGSITLARTVDTRTATLLLRLESAEFTYNGSDPQTGIAPYREGSTVMLPLRLAYPWLGFELTFSPSDRTAILEWDE